MEKVEQKQQKKKIEFIMTGKLQNNSPNFFFSRIRSI